MGFFTIPYFDFCCDLGLETLPKGVFDPFCVFFVPYFDFCCDLGLETLPKGVFDPFCFFLLLLLLVMVCWFCFCHMFFSSNRTALMIDFQVVRY